MHYLEFILKLLLLVVILLFVLIIPLIDFTSLNGMVESIHNVVLPSPVFPL